MKFINCPECGAPISKKAVVCPHCRKPIKQMVETAYQVRPYWRGFEWKSKIEILGLPLIHIAIGKDKETGKLLVAKGIIAVGQFGIGVITIAQFGIGILLGLGQFVGGILAVGQLALGIYFGLGQFATGITAIGQIALGKYVLAQLGYGEHVWSSKIKNPEAIEYFKNLWHSVKNLIRL